MEYAEMTEEETINFIRCLLLSNIEEKYVLSEFLCDFEDDAGYCLPLFGFETVVDFLKSIPEVVEVIDEDGVLYLKPAFKELGEWKSGLTPEHKPDLVGVSSEVTVRAKVNGSLHKPARGNAKKRRHRKRYRVRKKNVNKHLHDSKEDVEPEEPNKEVTYGGDILCGRCVSLKAEQAYEACIDKCLASVVLDERDIPQIDLKDDARIGDRIEVSVPEAYHPHKFTLHLKKYKEELTKLMARMLIFYNLYSIKYGLDTFQFVENEICAALYGTNQICREWYRAKIISFGSQKTTVLLIDYGIQTDVATRNLRFLDRIFGNLPAQGINGRLANVKPYAGSYWSEESCKNFYEHVFEKDLVADVITVDSEKRSVSVILSTLGENNTINDLLISGNFAENGSDMTEEESTMLNVFESRNHRGFMEPGEIGRIRRLRSEFLDSVEQRKIRKIPYLERNRELRKLFGMAESGESSSTSSGLDTPSDSDDSSSESDSSGSSKKK